jgi:hypothetical protein
VICGNRVDPYYINNAVGNWAIEYCAFLIVQSLKANRPHHFKESRQGHTITLFLGT